MKWASKISQKSLLLILIGVLILASCQQTTPEQDEQPPLDEAPAETEESPTTETEADEEAVPAVDCDGLCQGSILAAIDVVDSAGFHGMGEDLSEASALYQSGPTVGSIVAIDVIDNTGFHGMSEEIAEAESMEDINPRYLGSVQNALTVSRAAPFPEDLADAVAAFQADAEALADALESGDLEAAQEASHAIHSSQHDLSHDVYQWLGEQETVLGDGSIAIIGSLVAIDVINNTGFHGMSEEIAEAESMEDINPRNLGSVQNALTVSRAAPFPEELGDALAAFQTDAEALADALESGDLEAAQEASHAIHGSQHDLSHDVYEWLGAQETALSEGLVAVLSATTAIDIINSTGFHGMSEEIAEAESMEDINPRHLGSVQNALTVSRAAPFPGDLADAVAAFQVDAEALADALESGDLEAAQEASHAIHESQHDLSHDTYVWLGEQNGSELMAGLVNPRFEGTVENTMMVIRATPWYETLVDPAASLVTDLESLLEALAAGDVARAAEASHAVHETQHSLTHEVYHWLGEQQGTASDAGAVLATIDVIDSTGFHGISEEIAEAASMEDISPRNLGRVENALIAARMVNWPEDLTDAASTFIHDAEALAEALANNDLAAAQEASHAIHESQHNLSHDVYVWLDGQHGVASNAGAVIAALDLINTTGFHDMAHEIGHAESMGDVSPRNLGKVENALIAARMVVWSADMADSIDAFITDAEALVTALEGGDLEAAAEASEAIHGSQHDLSHTVYAWLGTEGADMVVTEVENADGEDAEAHDDEHASDEELPDEYAEAPVIALEVSDWQWSTNILQLTLGEPVVLEITNTGDMPHGIWIPELGLNVDTPPGETVLVPVTPDKTGEFFLGCNNPLCGTGEQHAEMSTTVVVTAP